MVSRSQPGDRAVRCPARSSSATHSASPSVASHRSTAGRRYGRAGSSASARIVGTAGPGRLLPGPERQPAGGDHLRQVDRVFRPEFGRGSQEPLAGGFELDQADATRQGQPERGESGSGANASAIGPARTGSSAIRSRSRLYSVPCCGLAERLGADPLPERAQPEDRLQAVRLADLADRALGRRQPPSGRTVADRAWRPPDGRTHLQSRPVQGSSAAAKSSTGPSSAIGSIASRPSSSSGPATRPGSAPRISSAWASPASGIEVASVSAKRLRASREPERQPGDQRLDGRRLVEMLGDLVGIPARADPVRRRHQPLRQPDRGEPRALYRPAPCGTPAAARSVEGSAAGSADGVIRPRR